MYSLNSMRRSSDVENEALYRRPKLTLRGKGVMVSRYRRPLKIKETLYEKYITEICER